jgi:hypothetical protein
VPGSAPLREEGRPAENYPPLPDPGEGIQGCAEAYARGADATSAEKLLTQALRNRDVDPPRIGERKTQAVLIALARDLAL